MLEDEEYLDKVFPKGKTKFRGIAIVLMILAREIGKEQMTYSHALKGRVSNDTN